MTQATETTAERVQRIVYPWAGLSFGAEELGSEIDRLNADLRDVKLAYDAQAKLIAEARAQIDALTRERDEARAEAWLGRERILSWFAWMIGGWNATQGEHSGRLRFDGVDYDNDEAVTRHLLSTVRADDQKKLASARAEVERLRPAAEAFGWWENYASNPSTTTWDIFQTAAQRARDFSFVEYRAVVLADDQTDSLKRGIFRAAKGEK